VLAVFISCCCRLAELLVRSAAQQSSQLPGRGGGGSSPLVDTFNSEVEATIRGEMRHIRAYAEMYVKRGKTPAERMHRCDVGAE
jgi:hypothetical protein